LIPDLNDSKQDASNKKRIHFSRVRRPGRFPVWSWCLSVLSVGAVFFLGALLW